MATPHKASAYSADVKLQLRVNGCVFPVAQIGSDRVVLHTASALPDGPAEIIATIDGSVERWSVQIDDRQLTRQVVPIRST